MNKWIEEGNMDEFPKKNKKYRTLVGIERQTFQITTENIAL